MVFTDKKTGEEITPESITQQLKEQGINVDEPEATVKLEVTEESPEVADLESEAREKGWKPDGPKSAEEFLRAEPLYSEIKARGKEIKELKATLDELKSHMDKQRELGAKEALQKLQEERVTAIEMGDVTSVNSLDTQIRQYEQETKGPAEVVVNQFVERNKSWINENSDEANLMKYYAEKKDSEIARLNLSPEAHIKTVEDELKKIFPHRFKESDEQLQGSTSVESDSAPLKFNRSKKYGFNDLNTNQKKAFRFFERQGLMTLDKYIKDLIDQGDLK